MPRQGMRLGRGRDLLQNAADDHHHPDEHDNPVADSANHKHICGQGEFPYVCYSDFLGWPIESRIEVSALMLLMR